MSKVDTYDLKFRPPNYWDSADANQSANDRGDWELDGISGEGGSEIEDVEWIPSDDDEDGGDTIASIVIKSVLNDVVEVKARRHGDQIQYFILDEYDTEFRSDTESSDDPLSLVELIGLIDSISSEDQVEGLDYIDSIRQHNIDGGSELEDMLDFVSVRSSFYPQLESYYAQRSREWYARQLRDRMEECPDCLELYDPFEDHECAQGEAKREKEHARIAGELQKEAVVVAPFLDRIEKILDDWTILNPPSSGAGGMVAAANGARRLALEKLVRSHVIRNKEIPSGAHTVKWKFVGREHGEFEVDFATLSEEAARRRD